MELGTWPGNRNSLPADLPKTRRFIMKFVFCKTEKHQFFYHFLADRVLVNKTKAPYLAPDARLHLLLGPAEIVIAGTLGAWGTFDFTISYGLAC